MSWHVVSWVMENSPARGGNRMVLTVMADHAHKDGEGVIASVPTLAFEARMSERSVQYAIAALEQAGCITQTGWSQYSTKMYRVEMTEQAACRCDREQLKRNPARCACSARFPARPRSTGGGATSAPPERPAHVAPGGRNTAQQGVQHGTDSLLHVAPKPSLEPTTNGPGTTLAGAGAREGQGEGAGPCIVVPMGATARDRSRLTRTAERTGARLIHEGRTSP